MEILARNPSADLQVYAIWYNNYPGDDRSKWNEGYIPDPRVMHLWDEGKLVGRWIVERNIVDYPRDILWNVYLLFGPEARWDDIPSPLISWGTPVYHRRHQLKNAILPLLEEAATAAVAEETATPVTDSEQRVPQVATPQASGGPANFDLMVIGGGSRGFRAARAPANPGRGAHLPGGVPLHHLGDQDCRACILQRTAQPLLAWCPVAQVGRPSAY